MELDNFEKRLAEKLDNFDPQLPVDDWSQIEAKLSQPNKKVVIPIFIGSLRKKIAVAASIALIIGVGLSILFISDNNKIEIASENIVTSNNNSNNINNEYSSDNRSISDNNEMISIDTVNIQPINQKKGNILAQTTPAINRKENRDKSDKTNFKASLDYEIKRGDDRIKGDGERRERRDDGMDINKSNISKDNTKRDEDNGARVRAKGDIAEEKRNTKEAATENENRASQTDIKQENKRQLTPEEAEQMMHQINREKEAEILGTTNRVAQLIKPEINMQLLASINPVENSSVETFDTKPLMMSPSSTSSTYDVAQTTTTDIITNHKLPFTLGLQVGISLNKWIVVHTGAEYTGLNSYYTTSSTDANSYYIEQQKLHYIGVPVKLSFVLWSNNWVNVYTSVGAKADWLVYGNLEKKSYDDSGTLLSGNSSKLSNKYTPLWSYNANIGTSIKLHKAVRFYLEPSYIYYHIGENNRQPESYITESQHNFILEGGIRFTF
ncbi:MAG: hypothetical protein R3Y59_00465 [bacterium]